jgi:hypothetical protein
VTTPPAYWTTTHSSRTYVPTCKLRSTLYASSSRLGRRLSNTWVRGSVMRMFSCANLLRTATLWDADHFVNRRIMYRCQCAYMQWRFRCSRCGRELHVTCPLSGLVYFLRKYHVSGDALSGMVLSCWCLDRFFTFRRRVGLQHIYHRI